MSPEPRQAVITGLGVVSAFGPGHQALADGLATGRPCLQEVDRSAGYHRRGGSRSAAFADREAVSSLVPPAAARRMSWLSKMAVGAARLAQQDAGLELEEKRPSAAVVLATAFGSLSVTEQLLRDIVERGPEYASPFLFPESVANAPAAQIAIACGARGPNVTLTQRSAGALRAVAAASREVRNAGRDLVFAGAAEEASPLLHSVLDRLRALARDQGAEEVARPFDRRRNGLVLADGAAVLTVEERSAARKRGASIWSSILGSGGGFDDTASAAGWGKGCRVLADGLGRCLERAGLAPRQIDLVISGANGSRAGDRLEAAVLKRVWGQDLPPVVAPKGQVGDYGGAFLAAATLLAKGASTAWPGDFVPDPELQLEPRSRLPASAPRTALVTCLAPGGSAAWLVLGPPE